MQSTIAVGDTVTGRDVTMGSTRTGLVVEVLRVRGELLPRHRIITDDAPGGEAWVECAELVDARPPAVDALTTLTADNRVAWLREQSDETLASLQRYLADLIDRGVDVDDEALDELGCEVRRRRWAANPRPKVAAPEHPNVVKIRERVAAQPTERLMLSHAIAARQITSATGDDRSAIALVLTTIEAELLRRDVKPPSRH